MNIDPTDLGEGFARRRDEAHGAHELARLLSRRRAEELHVARGGGVAGGEDRLLLSERIALFADAVERATVTREHAEECGMGPRGDLRHVLAAGRGQRVEDERALRVAHVDAVERQRVEVHVEAQRAVGALDECDGADEGVLHTAQAEMTLSAPAQRARERTDEGVEHVGAQAPVVREWVAQGPRQRAHPLANGHFGQDRVDEVRREVAHSAPETRRTEAAALAREGDKHLVAAAAAGELDTAVLEQAAAQVLLEVADHEARQAALLLGALDEPRPVLAHQRVQQRLLRASPHIPVRTAARRTDALKDARAHAASSVTPRHRLRAADNHSRPGDAHVGGSARRRRRDSFLPCSR
jgi:hypothetical protein